MGRKYVVKTLPDDQFEFVMRKIMAGKTDKEICAEYEKDYGAPLSKSALGRWRKAAGEELGHRYRIAQFQARELVRSLREGGLRDAKGTEIRESDVFEAMMADIGSRLFVQMHEVVQDDPLRALSILQRNKNVEVRREALAITRERVELERERLRCDTNLKTILAFVKDWLEYIGDDADGLAYYRKHVKKFTSFLKGKHAVPKIKKADG